MAQKRCFGCMQLKENSPVCEHCGFNEYAQNESHQLPLGTVLRNQYMVGKCLGQGGFGITYLGWDLNLDIPIAIKEYYPNSIVNRDTAQSLMLTGVATNMVDLYVSTRQRFLREAKVLAMLRNVPNIVQVHNFFEENNTAYIIMEYVKGIDLRRYMNLRGGRLSVDETLAILKPVMQALQRVHDHEIVHRDISPDNIMMMPDGTAKLLDFGAVRNVESADAEQELQHSTEAILKHGFAPMEQYQKRGALGPWTDEYAMCATIYYCLTGRVPPDAPQRMMEDVHPAWEKIPGLSPQQMGVLMKGMSLRAKDRYASISDLMEALYGPAPAPVTAFEPEPIAVTKPVSEPVYTQPMVTKPVAPIAPGPEPEEPLYTAPMVTKPLDTPDEVLKRKKPVGLIAVLALVAALAAGAWMLGGKDDPQMHATETEAPVISTEAPETTAPPVTTTEAPEIDSDAWRANVLMEQNLIGDYAFDTPIIKTNIQSITFRNTLKDAPEVNCWDVSEAQDGSVMAWAYQNGDKYDMYIAGEGGINAKYCEYMFYEFQNLEYIDFGNAFHTEEATNMNSMFGYCASLEYLDVSNWDVSNVKDMEYMFFECLKLTEVNLSGWDVSNVTNMGKMFYCCYNLKELNLSGWDTSNVTDMSFMFYQCLSLAELDLSAWDVSNVTQMYNMFSACQMLASIDVSNWDMPKVTTMYGMFSDCAALENLDVSNWDVSKVMNMKMMFSECPNLTELDLSGWDVSKVEYYSGFMDSGDTINGQPWEEFFKNPPAVTAATTDSDAWKANVLMAPTTWKTRLFGTEIASTQVKTIAFRDSTVGAPADAYDVSEAQDGSVLMWCENEGYFLKEMIIAADGGINAKNTAEMFRYFSSLESVDFGDAFHTDYAVDFTEMFLNCEKLKALDLSSFQTGNVTHMTSMFDGCNKLAEVNLSNWDVSNATNMYAMFQYCNALTALDLSAWDVSNVTNMDLMFKHCKSLKELDLSGWDVSKVEHYGWFMDSGDTINGKPWEEFFQ